MAASISSSSNSKAFPAFPSEMRNPPDWTKEISILPGDDLFEKLSLATDERLADLEYEPAASSRYKDIKCPKTTCISIQSEDASSTHYLHANWVGAEILEKKVIAAQSPIPKNEPVFWEYLLENPANIIDLTTIKDWPLEFCVSANQERLDFYPDTGSFYAGFNSAFNKGRSIWIKSFGEKKMDALDQEPPLREQNSSYEIKDSKTNKTSFIKRYNFLAWPDYGVVSVEDLHYLVEKAKEFQADPNQPLLIHCMAGMGRTGCLAVALALAQEVSRGNITLENVGSRVVNLVFAFRKERGPRFVWTKEQFNLLLDYAVFLIKGTQ